MPHTLASVDQSPVLCPKKLLLCDEDAQGWILEGVLFVESDSCSQNVSEISQI
jgi:hypothetical protein